jgi:hypothetical protein
VRIWLLVTALLLPTSSSPATRPAGPEAREVLAAWDAERSEAWAAGDVRRLGSLYTDGSVAGERDVAMLRRWLDRGRTVTGLRVQVLSFREVSRTDDRLVVTVVDRVVGGESGGEPLPGDGPTRHRLLFRLVDGDWLVSSVR